MGFESGWLAKVTFRAHVGTTEMVNVLHYDMRAAVTDREPSMQALADRLNVDVIPKFRALFVTGWTIDPVVVTEEKDPLNADAIRVAKTAGTGGDGTRAAITGDQLPSFCCRVYKLTTGKVGRSFRGRVFVGGAMGESDSAGSSWNLPVASNFAFLADAYIASIPKQPDLVFGDTGATVNWVVYSPTRRARDLDDYSNNVVTTIARPEVHSLRSRAIYS